MFVSAILCVCVYGKKNPFPNRNLIALCMYASRRLSPHRLLLHTHTSPKTHTHIPANKKKREKLTFSCLVSISLATRGNSKEGMLKRGGGDMSSVCVCVIFFPLPPTNIFGLAPRRSDLKLLRTSFFFF